MSSQRSVRYSSVVHVVTSGTDTNNVIGRGDIAAGIIAQGDIAGAGNVGTERSVADGGVEVAGGIVL